VLNPEARKRAAPEAAFASSRRDEAGEGGSATGRFFRDPRFWRCVCAVVSGALLSCAFPPVASSDGAWVALVPLLFVARWTPPAESFVWGFLQGIIFWLLNLVWLLKLGVTGGPWVLIIPGWVLLSAYCALYVGAFAACASAAFVFSARLNPARVPAGGVDADSDEDAVEGPSISRAQSMLLLVVIPILWIGFEYLRSVLFTGFPWNALGVSQFRNVTLIQVAAWGGVYAVSGLLVLMNVALTLMALRVTDMINRRKTVRFQVELAVALFVLALAWYKGIVTLNQSRTEEQNRPSVRIAAIQPAIAQMKKWEPGFEREIYDRLGYQTYLAVLNRPDLIVWPETAVPAPLENDPVCLEFVRGFTSNDVPLLVGTLEYEPAESGGAEKLYNSSMLVRPDGTVAARYRKQHLVPFGEYLPFDKLIPVIQRLAPLGFSCTAGEESTLFQLEHRVAPFSALICFEDIFAGLARRAVQRGAGLLINQTNDAWFDGTSGAIQHLSHCVFRCVENRVPAVRAANSGVTCFIDRNGVIEDSAGLAERDWDLGTPGFKVSTVRLRTEDDPQTYYNRHGDWALALPCGVVAAAFGVMVMRKERQRRRDEAGAMGRV
jgi:apolipoprotein N-acyltransferase